MIEGRARDRACPSASPHGGSGFLTAQFAGPRVACEGALFQQVGGLPGRAKVWALRGLTGRRRVVYWGGREGPFVAGHVLQVALLLRRASRS